MQTPASRTLRLCPISIAVLCLLNSGAYAADVPADVPAAAPAAASADAQAVPAPAAPAAAAAAKPGAAKAAANASNADEVVVVTGQRASLRKALSAQEKADYIVSVISADDIGQMPDKNAAEALARMPGVAVQRDQGEGRYIVVRGMGPDYNAVTINGAQVPSPEASRRAVALDVLPSGLIRSLEVSKTVTPDRDANSMGGTVNVKTLSAFDLPGSSMSMQAGVSRDENTAQSSPNIGLLWTNRFAGDTFGVAIGASAEKRKFGSDNLETGGAWSAGKLSNIEMREYLPVRERQAVALNLDYRPSKDQAYYLRSFLSQFSDDEVRDRLTLTNFSAAPGESFTARGERRLRQRKYTQEVSSLVFGSDLTLDTWKLELAAGAGSATDDTPESINDARFRGTANFAGVSFTGTELPLFKGPDALLDPSKYSLNSIQLQQRYSSDKERHVEWAASHTVDWGSAETDFKFGSKVSRRTKKNDTNQWVYNSNTATSPAYWGAGSNLMSAFVQGPLDYKFVNLGPGIDPKLIRARIAGLPRDGARSIEGSTLNDYVIDEDITSGFVQGSTRFGELTLLAGVRNERTDMSAAGFEVSGGTTVRAIQKGRKYSDWLPALQARYDIDNKTSLRAAWSNSVVRPNFSQFAPGIALASATEATIGNPDLKALESSNMDIGVERMLGNDGAASIYLFSKDVKNFTYTTNLAGTGAWVGYTSAVSYANGDKAKVSGIELSYQHSLRMLPSPWNDLVVNVNYSTIDSKADIARFDKPTNGFRSREIRMPGQAKNIMNLSLGYDNGTLSTKLSLNQKSNYLLELGGDILDASQDRYVDAQSQVDFSLGYKFDKRYQLVVEAANLNNEKYYVYMGNKALNAQMEQYGRTYKVSLKVNLF
jgi:TonB-dependent receptor